MIPTLLLAFSLLPSGATTWGTITRIDQPMPIPLTVRYIDEEATTVYSLPPSQRDDYHAWNISTGALTKINFVGAYDPVAHEPFVVFQGVKIPSPGKMLAVPSVGTYPSLVFGDEPSIYATGRGGNGITATFFGSITVGPYGPRSGRVLFWARESLKYIQYNPETQVLLVYTDLPNKLSFRTYQLGRTYKEAKAIPIPSYMRQIQKLQVGAVSTDMRRGLKRIGDVMYEYDLRTGERTALPQHEGRGYRYVGNDLYATKHGEGASVSAYDRATKSLYPIGPYVIMGSSPSGKVVVLQYGRSLNHPFLYIYRRSGSK